MDNYRLLQTGTKVTYEGLKGELKTGETLVATWLRDPANIPNARVVEGPSTVDEIIGKTEAGYYVEPCWYASTSGSDDPRDYGYDEKSWMDSMRKRLFQ